MCVGGGGGGWDKQGGLSSNVTPKVMCVQEGKAREREERERVRLELA